MGQKYGAREERKGGGQGEPREQTCVELGGGQVTFIEPKVGGAAGRGRNGE